MNVSCYHGTLLQAHLEKKQQYAIIGTSYSMNYSHEKAFMKRCLVFLGKFTNLVMELSVHVTLVKVDRKEVLFLKDNFSKSY